MTALTETERATVSEFMELFGERDVRWVHMLDAAFLARCVRLACAYGPREPDTTQEER